MTRWLFALLSLIFSMVVVSEAQETEPTVKKLTLDDWILDIGQRGSSIALALPELEATSVDTRIEASELSHILFDDIAFASVFKVVERERYPLAGKTNPLDYHAWSSRSRARTRRRLGDRWSLTDADSARPQDGRRPRPVM